ncbi:Farnesyl pyrophosphate synthase [Plecturocebus cupreus]
MNGDQKSDVYAQEKQDFIQHFSQIIRVLAEAEMGHPETGDATAWLRELQAFFLVIDDLMDSSLTCWGQIFAGIRNQAWVWTPSMMLSFRKHLQPGTDGKEHADAKKILVDMGESFQIRNDYLDLFRDPSMTSKVGTDIQDNKCSWQVVQCLQQATPEQYQILKGNYGQKEAEKAARVKSLYEELDLGVVVLQYEKDRDSHIMGLTEQYAAPLPQLSFWDLRTKPTSGKSDLETARAEEEVLNK